MAAFMRQTQFMFYGSWWFGSRGFNRKKNVEDLTMVSLVGRSVIVTGANSGLGFSTSRFLAARQANLHMVCRNEERGNQAREALLEEFPSANIKLWISDVGNKKDVEQLAEDFKKEKLPLDVLVCNAGVMLHKKEFTDEGVENTLAINAASNVWLVDAFKDKLQESKDARIILVSSGGGMTQPLLIANDYDACLEQKWDGVAMYARTKRMQMALASFYSKQLKNVSVFSMHPGWSHTPGVQRSMKGFYDSMKGWFRSVEQGADTINWLIASPTATEPEFKGQFIRDRAVEKQHFALGGTTYDESQESALYSWLRGVADGKSKM